MMAFIGVCKFANTLKFQSFILVVKSNHDKIMAIAQGGDDFVEKPFNLSILKAKIEAIIRRTYQ